LAVVASRASFSDEKLVIQAAVLDLRSFVPIDRVALLVLARRCGRVLVVRSTNVVELRAS
jgi:pyruvate/2-oxoglutarate/acetoin dehydrogenase E1 component